MGALVRHCFTIGTSVGMAFIYICAAGFDRLIRFSLSLNIHSLRTCRVRTNYLAQRSNTLGARRA